MSYLREDRYESSSLPAINSVTRSNLLNDPLRSSTRVVTTVTDQSDDNLLTEVDRVRFSSAGHVRERSQSPLFYPRPPSPTRKSLLELEDQIRRFREENARKDKLINQLTTTDYSNVKVEETISVDHSAASRAHGDLAALHLKLEGLQSQLIEAKLQVDIREEKIRELKLEIQASKESESTQSSLVSSLSKKIHEFESRYGSLEETASRSEMAVSALQAQLKSANDRVHELEARLRSHLEDRDSLNSRAVVWEGRYRSLVSHFSSTYSLDLDGDIEPDLFIARISNVIQDNAALRSKILSMKEYVASAETETKACRETIARLMSEAEKEQKAATKYSLELDSLRVERDTAVAKQFEYERDIQTLRERYETTSSAWMSTKKELEERQLRLASIEHKHSESATLVRTAELQLRGFREQLASMLSVEGLSPIEPFEEAIRERIKAMIAALKDKKAHIEVLESKMASSTEQLSKHYELQRSAESRTQRMEVEHYELKDRLKKLEAELSAADALRDGMRADKEKYLRLLEHLCRALQIDKISLDVGFDMVIDTLVARCEQLIKMESDSLNDRKTHIYNLQRKLKSLKEQLESRDLHIDLLRKKVAALEERVAGTTEIEREKESEKVRSTKLVRLVERYKQEMADTQSEMNTLKARLMEASDLKTRTVEQSQDIKALESKVSELEIVRQKQSRRISGLKDEVDIREQQVSSKKEAVNNTIQALSSELRTTKAALEEVNKRERQLLDLRQVLARMLGLDINTLAVPDFEIISRLEKLILAHQGNGVASANLDAILADMGEGFRAGYQDATRVVRHRSPTRRITTVRTRSRSASPSRKLNKDVRAY